MHLRDFMDRYNPFFTITGWIMALVFGVLSIYFYKVSTKHGEISFIVSRTKIFDSRISTPDIVVTRGEGGPQIKSDVYASEVAFWNSGDLRADSEGIKPDKPLTLSLQGSGEIVGTVLQGWNRSDLASYSQKVSEDKRALTIEWTKFRPGFGLRLTIMHTGDESTQIQVGADIFEFSIKDRSSIQAKQASAVLFVIMGRPVTFNVLFALLLVVILIAYFTAHIYYRVASLEAKRESFLVHLVSGRQMLFMMLLMFLQAAVILYSELFGRVVPPV